MSVMAFFRQLLDDGLDLAAAMTAAERFEQRALAEAPVERLGWAEAARVRAFVLARDGEVCRYCLSTTGPFEIDHVIPLSKGGGHDEQNLVVACRPCNRSKKDRTVAEWRRSK